MKKELPIYLRRRHVLEVLGVDSRQVSKMVEAGTLNPVRLHPRGRAFFVRDEVLKVGKMLKS